MSPLVDTRGLHEGLVGKRLRIQISDGEVQDVLLHELTVCSKPEPCCGITYVLISTNHSDGAKEKGAAYWTAFGEIDNFEVLGD
jgi:hypothetical protein